MATKIVTKNSSTASAAPTASDLVQGELAVNVTDKRLYTENASGAIVELGTNPLGAVTMASTLGVTGVVTANAGVVVDNITIDGTTIALSSGDLTLDVAGDINLDADGADIKLKDGGTEFARFSNTGTAFQIYSPASDKDITFVGNDGGSVITALTLDMSAAGAATFNSDVNIGGNLVIPSSINHTGDTNTFIKFNAADQIQLATGGVERVAFYNSETHFNDSGADVNFIVESDGNANMLFVDGGDNRVGIGSVSSIGGVQLNVLGAGGAFNQVSVGASANSSVSLGNHSSGDVISNLITSSSKFGGVIQGGTNGNLVVGIRDNDVTDGFFVVSGAGNQIASGYSRLRMSITPTTVVFNESGDNTDFRVESDGNANMLFVDGGANTVNIGNQVGKQTLSHLNVRNNCAAIEFGHENTSSGFFGTLGAFGNNGHPYIGFSTACDAVNQNTFSTYGVKGSLIKGDTSGNLIFAQVPTASATGQTPVERVKMTPTEFVINDASNDYDFRVESNNNSSMLVVDAGNDQVSITKAQSGTASLTVSNNSGNGSGIECVTTSMSSSSNNTNCFHFKGITQGVASYGLRGNGSSTWTSDERLKRDIVDADNGYLNNLNKVRLVNFKWKNDPESEEVLGVVAQEIEKIFPELVVEDDNAVGDGNTYKSVSYSGLNTIALKAIQELSAKVETLEARLAALES
jgi:hypothetical protein